MRGGCGRPTTRGPRPGTPATRSFELIREAWGTPIGIEDRAPSRKDDPAFREWWATYLRMGASPGAALALTRMNADIDVRDVLPWVRVPTLLLHRVGDRALRVEESRYMASRIPGARLVELPGEDHLPFVGDQDQVLDEIEGFLTGFRPGDDDARVLATVLTGRLARVSTTGRGDEDRERLQAAIARHVAHFRGEALRQTDDGLQAAFDGPARAIRCARTLADTAARLGWALRSGLDISEVTLAPEAIVGPAAERSLRLAAVAAAGEVIVSRSVCDLVAGAGLTFTPRDGLVTAEGERWPVYLVGSEAPRAAG